MEKKQNRRLKYVETYDNIVKIIKENGLKEGDLIPSENVLQKKFNVSRGTIRQAIALLKEDGLIYRHQGKGNIIINSKHDRLGLENVVTPIFNYNDLEYSKVEINYEFQLASDTMKNYFKKTNNFIVMVINAKYFIDDKIVCLAMYFIDYDDIKEYDIELNNDDKLKEFLDMYIKNNIYKSHLSIKSFSSRSTVALKMNSEIGNHLLYFSEIMLRENQTVLLYRKTYFDPNYFTFKVNRTIN